MNVVLETRGVMNDLMNWGVYKLKDKGTGILVSTYDDPYGLFRWIWW